MRCGHYTIHLFFPIFNTVFWSGVQRIPLTLIVQVALLQKRVVRIINKEKFDAHTDPIFKELKILKLDDIYLFHLGKFMYLFQNNLLPRPFGNLILRTNQVHTYNTRSSNQNLFYVPFCRTNLRQFCVHYIRALPFSIR